MGEIAAAARKIERAEENGEGNPIHMSETNTFLSA